jgi:hypothetical protein
MNEKILQIEEAGLRVGIGDYRPQKGGWYGTFDNQMK